MVIVPCEAPNVPAPAVSTVSNTTFSDCGSTTSSLIISIYANSGVGKVEKGAKLKIMLVPNPVVKSSSVN